MSCSTTTSAAFHRRRTRPRCSCRPHCPATGRPTNTRTATSTIRTHGRAQGSLRHRLPCGGLVPAPYISPWSHHSERHRHPPATTQCVSAARSEPHDTSPLGELRQGHAVDLPFSVDRRSTGLILEGGRDLRLRRPQVRPRPGRPGPVRRRSQARSPARGGRTPCVPGLAGPILGRVEAYGARSRAVIAKRAAWAVAMRPPIRIAVGARGQKKASGPSLRHDFNPVRVPTMEHLPPVHAPKPH